MNTRIIVGSTQSVGDFQFMYVTDKLSSCGGRIAVNLLVNGLIDAMGTAIRNAALNVFRQVHSFDSSILLCQRSEMQWRINYALCCFQESLIKSSAIDTKLISSQINLQIDQFYVRHRKLGRQRLFKQRYRSGGYECTFSMISGHQT